MSATTSPNKTTKYKEEPQQQPDHTELLNKILDSVMDLKVRDMDLIAQYAHEQMAEKEGELRKAAIMGRTILKLRQMFDQDLIDIVRSLSCTPLGFVCDRPNDKHKEPYSDEVLRDTCIEAVLKGFRWTQNEFNIIGGRLFGAQAGWLRKLREVHGLTDLKVIPGHIVAGQGQTAVKIAASWKLHGVECELVGIDNEGKRVPYRYFPVPQNSASNADNNTGKALRRAYKAIYEEVTGTAQTEPDGEIVDARPMAISERESGPKVTKTEALADKMGVAPAAAKVAETQADVARAKEIKAERDEASGRPFGRFNPDGVDRSKSAPADTPPPPADQGAVARFEQQIAAAKDGLELDRVRVEISKVRDALGVDATDDLLHEVWKRRGEFTQDELPWQKKAEGK